MYNAGQHDGNLGGRAGADALCASAKPAGLHAGYTNFKAFISIAPGDAIVNLPFPASLPVQGPTGTVIATNRADLLDGFIPVTLEAAGIMPAIGDIFWSGSDNNGNYNNDGGTINNCLAFTSNGLHNARLGRDRDMANFFWLNQLNMGCDNPAVNLLCIAY